MNGAAINVGKRVRGHNVTTVSPVVARSTSRVAVNNDAGPISRETATWQMEGMRSRPDTPTIPGNST